MNIPPTPGTRNNRSRSKNAVSIDERLQQKATFHENLDQNVIAITEDKLKLALIEQQEYIKSKRDWVTPFSIMITVIATLVTADFKNFASVPAATLKAAFLIVGVSSGVATLRYLIIAFKYRKKGDVQDFIDKLKNKHGNQK